MSENAEFEPVADAAADVVDVPVDVSVDVSVGDAETAPALVADEQLLASHDLARSALLDITPESTIGDAAGYTVEGEHVLSLRFENRMLGYPGWFWTVTIARVEGSEPTVLETELMPGENALLAPDWVPWAERLADYQAAQVAAAEARLAAGVPDDEDSDELDDLDELDDVDEENFETDGSAILHSGDVDGVDIDLADESRGSDDDSDDDDDFDEDHDDDRDSQQHDEFVDATFIGDADDPEGADRSY